MEEFVTMAPASSLTAHLTQQYNRRWGTATDSEIRSWRNSLTALADVVGGAGLRNGGVGVELRLPLSSQRVDASLVARNGRGAPQVVLVELKQWDSAAPSQNPDNVLVGADERLHPSVQAASYAEYLRDSHSVFTEEGFGLKACAFLHNMARDDAAAIHGYEYAGAIAEAPLFTGDDVEAFQDFLAESLSGGAGMELLPSLVAGRYSPSKTLLAGIQKSLRESPVWTLLDEQRLAYNVVRGITERTAKRGEKAVVPVVGGPGTGKSVIAAHLVAALAQGGRRKVVHATGSKAFTTNLRAVAPRGGDAVFRYFNQFLEKQTRPNEIDVLVLDEAHRIRTTSNDRFTKTALKSGISQAQELVRAARVSVFFLDERQNVRPGEIGTLDEVARAARAEGARMLTPIRLTGQFRCNGSSGYIQWIDELMSDRPAPAGGWREAGEYDFRVHDSPQEMEKAVRDRAAEGATARLVAGFCWPWSDPNPDGSLVPDVEIHGWRRPWNEKSPEQQKGKKSAPRPDRHPYFKWATEAVRIGEIGCIYSAQGFEFDYVGVILGNDLVWREPHGWVAAKDASHDSVIRRSKLPQRALADLLQHTYRVLLTRGMKGTFVYSTDFETRAFLHSLVER